MPSRSNRRALGRYGRRSGREGREAAQRHIREARELTAELGGTDQDVKRYFFDLSSEEVGPILDEYGRRHGAAAREYAECTIPKWKSGKVQMSGRVASRLFRLLPPRMPLKTKYQLTKNLWTHVGPSSSRRLRIGPDATLEDILTVAGEHMAEVAQRYKVPVNLEKRFAWLADGDVQLRQELLNRLQDGERKLVIEAISQQLPVMRGHAFAPGTHYTQRLTQTVHVGKHELELAFDQSAVGVRLEDVSRAGSAPVERQDSDLTWLWWAAGAGVVLLLILSQRGGA